MALSASDLPMMYQLLSNSLSGDVTVRKPAEAALSQSESRPGFCSCLMVYYSLRLLDFQGFLAVIFDDCCIYDYQIVAFFLLLFGDGIFGCMNVGGDYFARFGCSG